MSYVVAHERPGAHRLALAGVLAVLLCPWSARALTLDQAQVAAFIDDMARRHGFDAGVLRATFDRARGHARILEAISRPAERKPWHQYRPIFLTEQRIEGGLAFWQRHEAALARAAERYGVPPEIVVAIVGVETLYGRDAGSYPVLEAVATLAFHYPRRAEFFRGQLEQFLLLAREENVDPLSIKGSYAGAMGMPQFIASSFRQYAVDFDADGRRDIWHNVDDVIGSVANYLHAHGWQRAQPIAVPGDGTAAARLDALAQQGLEPRLPVARLQADGVLGPGGFAADALAAVIRLEQAERAEYWVGFRNFYAITRYNHSAMYAMAVFQLAEQIRMRRAA